LSEKEHGDSSAEDTDQHWAKQAAIDQSKEPLCRVISERERRDRIEERRGVWQCGYQSTSVRSPRVSRMMLSGVATDEIVNRSELPVPSRLVVFVCDTLVRICYEWKGKLELHLPLFGPVD
jgi:hypothetical protein